MFEITGIVKEIFPLMTLGSGFTKREFVLTTEERYPQELKFECLKERTELLDSFSDGARVTVSFDLRGREWKGKYFVNLNAWKLEAAGDAPAHDPDAAVADDAGSADEEDQIPF